jgi:hypothetical protein
LQTYAKTNDRLVKRLRRDRAAAKQREYEAHAAIERGHGSQRKKSAERQNHGAPHIQPTGPKLTHHAHSLR